jgi:hypothetical protein
MATANNHELARSDTCPWVCSYLKASDPQTITTALSTSAPSKNLLEVPILRPTSKLSNQKSGRKSLAHFNISFAACSDSEPDKVSEPLPQTTHL